MATPRGLREAVEDLGLQRALGFVRMLRLSADDPLNYPEPEEPQPHPPVDLAELRCAHACAWFGRLQLPGSCHPLQRAPICLAGYAGAFRSSGLHNGHGPPAGQTWQLSISHLPRHPFFAPRPSRRTAAPKQLMVEARSLSDNVVPDCDGVATGYPFAFAEIRRRHELPVLLLAPEQLIRK